jgi:hypothetical protein
MFRLAKEGGLPASERYEFVALSLRAGVARGLRRHRQPRVARSGDRHPRRGLQLEAIDLRTIVTRGINRRSARDRPWLTAGMYAVGARFLCTITPDDSGQALIQPAELLLGLR